MLNSASIAYSTSKSHSPGLIICEPVSIIVPAFNESKAIGEVLDKITHWMSRDGIKYELIVVDDGSTDGTADAVQAKGVRLIRHSVNRGYGAALKTAIRQSHQPLIAIIDSDGTYPPDALPQLLMHMDDCDMVVGSRTGEHVKIP